jgi:hypothetical protein
MRCKESKVQSLLTTQVAGGAGNQLGRDSPSYCYIKNFDSLLDIYLYNSSVWHAGYV